MIQTDVSRDADGTWHIKAGARVRVRLTMVATARRYHVALVDPLPAGFEALNPSLATTGSIPRDDKQTGVAELGSRSYGYGWWWWRPEWFEHQNLRDDRAEAFTSLLVGRRVQVFLRRARHHAGSVRRATGESGRDVPSGNFRQREERIG